MKQKLLIVYYNFPPVKVPGAVRISNFYREARKYFTEVHALTSAHRQLLLQDHSLETHCPHITEVPAWDLRRLTLGKKQSNTPYLSGNSTDRPLIAFFRRLINSFPFNILVGDGGAYYIWRGYQAGKRLVEEQGITHVFSTFRPYSDHIVAYLLKRRFPHLVWVADFRDLHVDPVLDNVVWPAFQKRCNRWVLRRADVVSTVSEGLASHLRHYNPNVMVMRNGFQKLAPPIPHKKNHAFTICYTGSLIGDLRNPELLFKVIQSKLKQENWRLKIIYAGKDGERWDMWIKQYGLQPFSENLGTLSREEALKLQRQADMNLLLTYTGNNLTGNLTGKLFEYISNRKPILALISGKVDDELSSIVNSLGHSTVFRNSDKDLEALSLWLDSMYDNWIEDKAVSLEINTEAAKKHQWDYISSMFVERVKHV